MVGVAIKEALETSVSHFISPDRLIAELNHLGEKINFPDSEIGLYPEAIRLTVFLALIVRFYFGSAYYFGAAYEASTSDRDYPTKNYGVDFVFGFIHFTSFVILALIIDIHTVPVHWFPHLVGFILVYDIFWYAFSFRQSTSKLVFWWMIVNLINASISAVVYLTIEYKYKDVIKAEIWALWIVIAVSVVDIGLMMMKKPFFHPLSKIAPHDAPPPTTDMPPPAEPVPD